MKDYKVSIGTWVRTVALFVAFLNQLLAIYGKSPIPFNEQEVELVVSTIATGIISLYCWWKNNSFSKEAIESDEYMKKLKNNK